MIEYTKEMWGLASEGEKQGVLFFVVFYLLIVCLYSFIKQILIRQWPVAKGTLLTASVEQSGVPQILLSDQEYKVNSLYAYQVSGKVYQGKRVSPWIIIASHNAKFILKTQLNKIKKNEDGSVNVIYNPKAPAKSYLLKPGVIGMVITFGIAVIPLLLYFQEYCA
ncbi:MULTISPECIES: DUF3592 domain-containing protein [Alteromonadaceae]|uniref:DUF3592 domain-containing protein n=1 Tax=Alteromonadaceae TaxID=72275 RepID=UPI0031094467